MGILTDRDKRAFLVGYMAGGSFARKDDGGDKFASTEGRLMQKWIGDESYSDPVYLQLQKAFITEVLGIVVDTDTLHVMDLVEKIRAALPSNPMAPDSDDEDKL